MSIRLLSFFVVPGLSFGDSAESLVHKSGGSIDVRRYAAYPLERKYDLALRRRLNGMS